RRARPDGDRSAFARIAGLLAGLGVLAASAGSSAFASEAAGPSAASFTDPFAYCKAVGTIDEPDGRYTGPKMPESLAAALRDRFKAPRDASLEAFVKNSFWRCMDGKVYACNVGANIPCQEKADASREPNAGMIDYCKTNPFEDHIPAF